MGLATATILPYGLIYATAKDANAVSVEVFSLNLIAIISSISLDCDRLFKI